MEKTTVELVRCPKCEAMCMPGNDNDCITHCANCSHSFNYLRAVMEKYSSKEFEDFQLTHTRKRNGGWTAFVKKE